VECAFGILSNKWRIFHKALNVPKLISKGILKVCMVRERNGQHSEDMYEGHTNLNQAPTRQDRKTANGVRYCIDNHL
jgi:hypothetical protein